MSLRLGLCGYGVGGRYFHAPFIAAADGIELAGVVTRSPERRATLESEFPGTPAYDSLSAMIEAGVDAVTISTPPQTRRALVLEAAAAGVHVVADKPFAPSAAAAKALGDRAAEAGILLSVFHNRRWDADIRTVASVLAGGALGEVWRVESTFDLDMPETLEAGSDGGLLRDLGSHLVDQMYWLFGPVDRVYAELDWLDLPEGRTDCGFAISMVHAGGVKSRVSASKMNRLVAKEYRVYAAAGSYLSSGTDVQAQAVFAGLRPADLGEKWGYEAAEHWGTLATAAGRAKVPSQRGAYQDYYTQFAAAVRGDAPVPVPADEVVDVLAVLDAARASALEGRVVEVVPVD